MFSLLPLLQQLLTVVLGRSFQDATQADSKGLSPRKVVFWLHCPLGRRPAIISLCTMPPKKTKKVTPLEGHLAGLFPCFLGSKPNQLQCKWMACTLKKVKFNKVGLEVGLWENVQRSNELLLYLYPSLPARISTVYTVLLSQQPYKVG